MRKYFLAALVLASACAQKPPTTVSEIDTSFIDRAYKFEKDFRPLKITEQTIVLDTRSFFDYQLMHLPGAIHINPSEYYFRRWQKGNLEEKGQDMARRLALHGITPFSHVVVVGPGLKGMGDEVQVALTLLSLGIERVQLGSLENLKFLMTNKNKDIPQRANQRTWKPRNLITLACPGSPGNREGIVIQVGKKAASSTLGLPSAPVAQKNWKDFINPQDFSPNYKIKEAFKELKIGDKSLLMVTGADAPMAVFSLIKMGYGRACLLPD